MGVNVGQFSVSPSTLAFAVDDDNIASSVLSIGNQIGEALSKERGPCYTRDDL